VNYELNKNMFVSVDLGNSRIMMMAAERQSDGTFKIIAVEKEETPIDSIQNGVVRKPSEIASTISRLLKQMENRLENKLGNKYEIKNFYTAVNGRSLRSIRHDVLQSFPVATEIGASELNDLRKALLGKLDTEHHMYSVTNEEYRIDGNYVRNPMNIVCREISANYLLVMGRPDIRENLDKCINRIAIPDVYSDALAPVAMADALLTNDDRTNGVIHLNFGAATTTVTVYQDGYLRHLAVVPFGGKHITTDLSTLGITINYRLQRRTAAMPNRTALERRSTVLNNGRLDEPLGIAERIHIKRRLFDGLSKRIVRSSPVGVEANHSVLRVCEVFRFRAGGVLDLAVKR
jgi:cell division protein FtsA